MGSHEWETVRAADFFLFKVGHAGFASFASDSSTFYVKMVYSIHFTKVNFVNSDVK